ncbi:MAG: hypothetical protein JSV80_14430 [Acidobacteriota bacterium]|nr:MAG: hypothetical protein JSV80_14430 [Acidobacteriota bacterium]
MKASHAWTIAVGVAALLVLVVPPICADTIEGEVVQVKNRVRTHNQGEFHQIRVRTQQGQEIPLMLGQAGSCQNCVNEGDQVRVRTMNRGEADEPLRVRTMQNMTTGEGHKFRSRSGDLIQVQTRTRARFQNNGIGPAQGQATAAREANGRGTDSGRMGGGRNGRGGGRR